MCTIQGCIPQFSMMTSSNGNIFRVTGPLCGEFTGPGEFPTQRPATRSFDVYFDLRLNKRLSKQPWGWWFETLSWSLWRHRNGTSIHTKPATLITRIVLDREKALRINNKAKTVCIILGMYIVCIEAGKCRYWLRCYNWSHWNLSTWGTVYRYQCYQVQPL